MFFHLSPEKLRDKILYPRIPNNYFTKNGYEDSITPRVCLAPSIKNALMALGRKHKDDILHVYIPIKKYKIYHPSLDEVPDVKITGEVWAKEPIMLKYIGSIKVLGDKGKNGFKFKYGDYTAELYEWEYKVLE